MRSFLHAPLLLLLSGCPKAVETPVPTAPALPVAEPMAAGPVNGLTLKAVDLDNDGRPEVFNYYRVNTELLLRKDSDLNRDGRIDVWTEFNEARQRIKETYDGDFDGKPDCVDHFIDGKRTSSEIDTDFNGTYDLFKYYKQVNENEPPVAFKKESDTDGDGRIDLWEYLDARGNVEKVGRDVDGDGRMDQRDP